MYYNIVDRVYNIKITDTQSFNLQNRQKSLSLVQIPNVLFDIPFGCAKHTDPT